MSHSITAFWHKESFSQLMTDRLPQLLADRLPLTGYHLESTGTYTCRVRIALASTDGDVEIEYTDIPQPNEEGMFDVDGKHYAVVPDASHENLEVAEIRCVGEQLYDYIEVRLGEARPDLPWDTSLVQSWIPLDKWVHEFLRDEPTAQPLQETNWLDKHTHLRRIHILCREKVFTHGQFGRACPFEMPEGPSLGRILTVAKGAEIRDRKLIVADENPEATLGLSTSMIPFLEHDDPSRILMGANMMRQWMVPSAPETAPLRHPHGGSTLHASPEPALVQTGYEPNAPDFWCGRDLLTAFISWGGDTFEDGIVISESCAERLSFPYRIEPGDKISNRHGTKGVVSRILPDDEMPHLADGTPAELVFSFGSIHGRMNPGQLREAVMGRIARTAGETAIVPPFHAPSAGELLERLKKAGLPEDGMEILTLGRNGKKLDRPSTVGWVYWGRTVHIARDKITASGRVDFGDLFHLWQNHGELEYYTLCSIEAFETLAEQFNTRDAAREDADTLIDRVTAGTVEQAGPPTPMFSNLTRRLSAAGISAELAGDKLNFQFARPEGKTLTLAKPVAHPWLTDRLLEAVGICDDVSEYPALADVNARAERMFKSDAPESLAANTLQQLQKRVRDYLDVLLKPEHLRFKSSTLFGGRAVIAPGPELRADQVGIPTEIAWVLFGPQVTKELGSAEEVQARSQHATQALDDLMARSWIILHRAPAYMATSFTAFHPVRHPGRVIRVHPFVSALMNADFDGDQAVVLLPITEEGQREAGERLSIVGHLKRDPDLCEALAPGHDVAWGLASLSLTPEGCQEIEKIVGTEIPTPDGVITQVSLATALKELLRREGIEHTIEVAERLTQRGFEVAQESGASMSPFIGASLERPSLLSSDDDETAWNAYAEELLERIASSRDFADTDLGPQLLAVKSRARGRLHRLASVVGARGAVPNLQGENVIVRHGYADGLMPEELYITAVGSREALVRYRLEQERLAWEVRDNSGPKGFTVLARAMRAKHPGIVFARAAATGEIDPLADVDSRLFVGLRVTTQ